MKKQDGDSVTEEEVQKLLDTICVSKKTSPVWYKNIVNEAVFNITYFWRYNIIQPIYIFTEGIKNLIIWRKVIWRDRWWDHMFFHDMLELKLTQMQKGWPDAHYVGSEEELRTIGELLKILTDIRKIEDTCDSDRMESSENISTLYEEFGTKLFQVVEWTEEYQGKKYTKTCSQFEKFWD